MLRLMMRSSSSPFTRRRLPRRQLQISSDSFLSGKSGGRVVLPLGAVPIILQLALAIALLTVSSGRFSSPVPLCPDTRLRF